MQPVPNPQHKPTADEKAARREVANKKGNSADQPGPLRVAAENVKPRKPPDVRIQAHLIKRQAAVLQLVAQFMDQDSLATSLLAVVDELHNQFGLNRAAIGLYSGGKLEVAVISQQASVDRKTVEIGLLAEAMEEACEQDSVIHYPVERGKLRITEAHRALIDGREQAEVCSIPLCHQGETVGAVLFERSAKIPWSPLTLELFRQIAVLVAPMVVFRQQGERSFRELLLAGVRQPLESLLQPRHLLAKCFGILFTLLLIGAHFLQVPHTVSAEGALVPIERRIIAAPLTGYIETVNFRPGDRVAKGDLLLQLDTRDLKPEQDKWENEILSAASEFRSAMANHDRKGMAVTLARQSQARAQLDLIAHQISRAKVVAPADGIVLSGDLSQSLGAPVERGETLLEIAPEEGYEVHLLVDERDIPLVAIDQRGTLALKSNPGDEQTFTVTSVHPIAESAKGNNIFRVEATLENEPVGLRPGQTGVGKVEVGQTSLLWLWTRRFVTWLQLKVWELAP